MSKTTMHKLEVELSEAEAAEMRTLLESGDEAAIGALVERLTKAADFKRQATELRLRMLRDVVLCAHHWLHEGEHEKPLALLCTAVALLEGDAVTLEQINALFVALNEGNAQRIKKTCEGSA